MPHPPRSPEPDPLPLVSPYDDDDGHPVRSAVAASFPPAEGRATRSAEEAQRLAWRLIALAGAVWLFATIGLGAAFLNWLQHATVATTAGLRISQGIVLYHERTSTPLQQARDGTMMREGDTLEVQDNAFARLELPQGQRLHLGPGTRIVLAELREGRFNSRASRLAVEHTAGLVRAEVAATPDTPLALETPYGTVVSQGGDFVTVVRGTQAQVLVRQGAAIVLVGADQLPLGAGQRAELALSAAAVGPLAGAPNLIKNGDFAAGFVGWQARDTQEANRTDRLGERGLVVEAVEGQERTALRVTRTSDLQTHNETGVVQELNADVSVYPEVILSGLVKVRAASLSGGGYLGTEYPLMVRLRYRDAAGNGQTWYQGFYYQNSERRPVERGALVAADTWTRFQLDLTHLPERPWFLYAIEVLGAGHDFDAAVTDLQLIAQ